jgi:hypothetical protein
MKYIIPEQHTGGKMDTTAKVTFPSVTEAKQFYQIARRRLLNVSGWAEICKVPVSVFTLTDATGVEVKREVMEGDFLKIDIPGPGTHTGDGFDWVRIEKIVEEASPVYTIISLQARPAPNPADTEKDTAHFFKPLATSTFQIKQIENEVYAEEHGRNEVPNTSTGSLTDNIRNSLVGWTAKIGFSYPQWKSLVEGLVETKT